jgi:glucose 1-dehydrogenase
MCWPGNIPYGMAKAAINHMASIMALELATYKINVNVINPGWIDTPGERRYSSDEVIAAGALKIPWGRLGVPEDIAKAAAFLCSGDADYITGTTLRVDGGMVPGQITPPDKSPVLTDSWMDAFKKK